MRLLSLFGLHAFSLHSHDFSHTCMHRFYATKKYKKAAKVIQQTLLN
ncbi:hypothetical protein HMPREF3208_00745 [Gardnerella vaginalis]|uniref:Uncharacterized protein n=1 Tax=Gardnerella vaginalis TaxID=2702 RepID=A0A133NWL7_GARVA|nr:hypothetical protein HMPREF3208_00745 [Gardnerella vaginalis]